MTGLTGYADAWDALVSDNPLASPFLRSWWLEAVDEGRASHLLVLSDGALVGGVPLARDRVLGIPRYRFAGQGVLCPDHLDLLALPGREEEVVLAIRTWFAAPGQRILDLAGLRDGSLLARAVGGAPERLDVAPFEPLPGDGSDYLAGRSANFRRSVRRAERRLTAAGITHRRVVLTDLPGALAAFRALQDDRDGRGPLLDALPTLAQALAAGLERGEARVDVLETSAEVVAVSLAFTVAGRLSLYQMARSLEHEHRSAATVLLHRVISDATSEGCREVDLLRGDEDYKSSYADSHRDLFRLRVGHGRAGRGVVVAHSLAVSAIRRARRWRSRVDAWRRRTPS